MQRDLASMLQQKSHLAALGLAVSKINHDLRNLLTSAQLFSEGLTSLPDPRVQRFAPKLMRALERAIAFCESTLSYGRVQEPPPDRKPVAVEALVEEVHETLALAESRIAWIAAIERGLDRRCRPRPVASRAAQSRAQRRAGAGDARAERSGARSGPHHRAARGRRGGDRGVGHRPGHPGRGRASICSRRSRRSARSGGTGLGLVIAAELVRAHGGEIKLVEGTIGATFRLTIPDRAVELDAHRNARARA